MANTITSAVISTSRKEAIVYWNLVYVDTATNDSVIYDSSAIATTVSDVDPLDSSIISVYASVSSASTARCWLEWDADTDVVALGIPVATNPTKVNFRSIGGLPNQGGAGKTGDININASGLSTGDIITVVLHVRRD